MKKILNLFFVTLAVIAMVFPFVSSADLFFPPSDGQSGTVVPGSGYGDSGTVVPGSGYNGSGTVVPGSGYNGSGTVVPGSGYSGGGCPSSSAPTNFRAIVCIFIKLAIQLIPLLVGVALLVFFWGLVKFIYKAGSETAHEEAKNIMVWGIVGLFVMVSIWGIVSFLYHDFFGLSYLIVPGLPQFSN